MVTGQSLVSSMSGRVAEWSSLFELCQFISEMDAVPPHVKNSADVVIFKDRKHTFSRLLVLTMSRNRRTDSDAPLFGRTWPLYATIFHAAATYKPR